MNRNHQLITLYITYTAPVYEPDPQAPGGGEMVRTGTQKVTRSFKIIATSPKIAEAWALDRFPDAVIKGHQVDPLDAVIETHTY